MTILRRNVWRILWFGLAVAIATGIGSLNLPSEYRLWKEQTRTHGIVTKLEPENHNSLYYTFETPRGPIHGGGRITSLPPDQRRPGAVIDVWYASGDPKNCNSERPNTLFLGELLAVVLAATIGPTLLVMQIQRMVRAIAAWMRR
jgi:hypothetical protein